MEPRVKKETHQQDFFRSRLENIINMKHELVSLSKKVNWPFLVEHFEKHYAKTGRPGIPTRMMCGLHILKHMYALSDEEVCQRWTENPYFQYFCGEEFFQHNFPIERSSMTHWRQRVGDASFEFLLQESLMVAQVSGALKINDCKKVIVDTTVQEKAITFPTDQKLLHRAIVELGKIAKQENISLRQSYVRVSKEALIMSQRYTHAKQMKRAKKQTKKLKTYLGRIRRDIGRKAGDNLSEKITLALEKAAKIEAQKRRQQEEKIYSWHAPEVECIGKGKAHKPYEFGCKVSIMINLNPSPGGHFVLHAKALHGRPYDGHTLKPIVESMQQQTGISVNRTYVDKGYRGHKKIKGVSVFKSGQIRGVSSIIKRELKRRSAIEPIIGHLKNDGLLGRNYLKGQLGDKQNALLSAIGFNFRQLAQWFRKHPLPFFDFFQISFFKIYYQIILILFSKFRFFAF